MFATGVGLTGHKGLISMAMFPFLALTNSYRLIRGNFEKFFGDISAFRAGLTKKIGVMMAAAAVGLPAVAAAGEGQEKLQAVFEASRQRQAEAIQLQRAAVSRTMEQAIASQRMAVTRQSGAAGSPSRAPVSFFSLPWPALRPSPGCHPMQESQIDPLIEAASRREGVATELLRAVIARESAFYPCAVSVKGAMGLMQLMPETAVELGASDPFDARQNIDSGAKYLGQLLVRYRGDVAQALAAYNAGAARVDAAGGVPAIPETLRYVETILRAWSH